MARLIEELKKLPGVGGKTAQRMVLQWGMSDNFPLRALVSQDQLMAHSDELRAKIDAGAYVYFTFLRPFAELAGVELDWTLGVRRELPGHHEGLVRALSFSPNGDLLASGSATIVFSSFVTQSPGAVPTAFGIATPPPML